MPVVVVVAGWRRVGRAQGLPGIVGRDAEGGFRVGRVGGVAGLWGRGGGFAFFGRGVVAVVDVVGDVGGVGGDVIGVGGVGFAVQTPDFCWFLVAVGAHVVVVAVFLPFLSSPPLLSRPYKLPLSISGCGSFGTNNAPAA